MDMADLKDINNQVKQLEHDQIKNFVKHFNGIPVIIDHKLTGTNLCILVSPQLYAAIAEERKANPDG